MTNKAYLELKSFLQSSTIMKIFMLAYNNDNNDIDLKRNILNIIEDYDNNLMQLYKDYDNDKED